MRVSLVAAMIGALLPGSSVSGIRLVRAEPPIVRAACRDAQAHVRVRVTCPTLIPATKYTTIEGLHGNLDFSPHLWGITLNNGDNGHGYVHWMAGGGTIASIRSYLLSDRVNVVKGLPRLVATRRVQGYRVALYEYPPYPAGGANGGHTAAFVWCGSDGVYVSIHGHGHEAAAAAMAVDLAHRSRC